MFLRLFSALVVIGVAASLLVVTWPQAFGLQNTWIIAHLVSFRALTLVGAVAAVLFFLLLRFIRPLRALLGAMMVVLIVFAVANGSILAMRGFAAATDDAGAVNTPTDAAAVTVLSWNTLGDAPGADAIAELALTRGADVVTLPETTEETGVQIAETMRAAGRPMWVHTLTFGLVSKARSTTLLISPDLGSYTVTNAAGPGPPGNTNVLPTVVAEPVNGSGPTIVAVHAVAPIQYEMANWRSDLNWLAALCQGTNVIMAGDFNATLDHLAGRSPETDTELGRCADAALSAKGAALGTWPTRIPAALGTPIDHILATPNWRVAAFELIDSRDDAGSDHRPIVATLTPVP